MQVANFDVAIIGGGPVGLILALGLAKQQRQVCLIEKQPFQKSTSFDGRALALTYGSVQLLKSLDIWQQLAEFTTPIKHVHISQKGYLGLTKIHADEMNVEALGYSVTASDLGSVLWQLVAESALITLQTETELSSFKVETEKVQLSLKDKNNQPQQQQANLIIGADGTESKVRKLSGIKNNSKSYNAFGVLAKIETEQHPKGWSYERFTTEGPVALLPLGGHFHKAVMVVPTAKKEAIMALNDDDYINLFAEKMGERLGEFTSISARVCYPLIESYAEKMVAERTLLIGNASHTQHPVAAQGLNLGITDIKSFLALSTDEKDLGKASLLTQYQANQAPEHERIMNFTDSLINVFEKESSLIGHLRGLGLMAMSAMPKSRHKLARMAMGVTSNGN